MKIFESKTNVHYTFFLFLLSITIFRLIYASQINLVTDEAYYWAWSRRLSFGYYDSGTILAWIIRFFSIFGHTELLVRLGSIIASILTNVILYSLSLHFLLPIYALLVVIFVNFTPAASTVSILMMHDSFMVLFWLLSILLIYKALQSKNSVYWYLTGLASGLGLWSKDNFILFIPCTFLFLISSHKNRFWLKKKEPYLMILIMLLVFSPIIIWNFTHDFVTYKHIFSLGSRYFLSFKMVSRFLGAQLGLISPLIWLGIMISWIKLSFKTLKKQDNKILFLLCYSLPVFLFFLVLSFKTKVRGNWAGFSYYLGLICMFVYFKEYCKKKHNLFLYTSFILTFILCTIMLFPKIIYPVIHKLPLEKQKIENFLKKERTNSLYGFDTLGTKVKEYYLTLDTSKTFIFSIRYQLASQLAFYSDFYVYCLPIHRRMNQYDIWNKADNLDNLIGKNAIFVTEINYINIDKIKKYFESVEFRKNINVYRPDVKTSYPIRSYDIFFCKNFKGIKKQKLKKY